MIIAAYPSEYDSDLSKIEGVVVVDVEGPDPAPDPGEGWDEATDELLARSLGASRVVPLTEEAVVPAARVNSQLGLDGLTLQAAINATERAAQRQALPPHLSPRWISEPFVIKGCASVLSDGVHARRLREFKPSARGVAEEYLPPPQIEVSGWVADAGRTTAIAVLLQRWDDDERRILRYEKAPMMDGAILSAIEAVDSLGLTWCGWCVEMRRPYGGSGWRVIEVNARLGEDRQYRDLVMEPGICPTAAMLRWMVSCE